MDTPTKTANDEGWAPLVLTIFVAFAVSVFTVVLQKRFDPDTQATIVTDKVLVLSLADWVDALPKDATQDQMNEHFAEARKAAERASEQGYIVLHEAQAVTFPKSSALIPGMFPGEGKKK